MVIRTRDVDDYAHVVARAVRERRALCGVSQHACGSIGLERYGSLTVDRLETIARRLGTTPSALLRAAEQLAE